MQCKRKQAPPRMLIVTYTKNKNASFSLSSANGYVEREEGEERERNNQGSTWDVEDEGGEHGTPPTKIMIWVYWSSRKNAEAWKYVGASLLSANCFLLSAMVVESGFNFKFKAFVLTFYFGLLLLKMFGRLKYIFNSCKCSTF